MATKKTAAKKAAPRKTAAKKASAADSWAEGYRPLVEAAREGFGFLVRDHGFSEPAVRIDPPSAMVTFARGGDFVRVESEYLGEPFFAVRVGDGPPLGLAPLVAELDPGHGARPAAEGVLGPEAMRAAIAHAAAFVAAHPELLRPDPALWARLAARQAGRAP